MLTPALLDAVDARIKARREADTLPATPSTQPPPQPLQQQPKQQPQRHTDQQTQWYDAGPMGFISSAANGVNKALLETGDLIPDLMGHPGWMDENVPLWKDYRQAIERREEALTSEDNPAGVVNGLASGLAQFGAGWVGAGKVMGPLKATMEATKGGRLAYEAARGAGANFVTMDPHAQRLSDLVQQTPFGGPLTEYLAATPSETAQPAQPSDADLEDRLKAAMDEAGVPPERAAILFLYFKSLKLFRLGDEKAGQQALDEARRLKGPDTPWDKWNVTYPAPQQ